jgi:multiple antibiotic resistance protein
MTEKFIRDALILWTTIDPIGTLAIFTAITGKLDSTQRKKTAWKAILYSAAILLGAIVIGQVLLSSMGIRLLSLQVAGGIILSARTNRAKKSGSRSAARVSSRECSAYLST